MPAWPLRVETDEPGRKLVLTAEIPAISRGLLAGIGAFIVLLVAGPTVGTALFALATKGSSTHTLAGLAFASLYPAGTAVGLFFMARRVRSVSRFAILREFGRIEIREFRLLSRGPTTEILRVADLRAMSVRATVPFTRAARALPGGARAGARDLAFTVRLEFQPSLKQPPREIALAVEGIDRIEEGSDLALRLAHVAGLGQRRVVRSDPREVELEFSAQAGAGFAGAAASLPKADYARDRISDEARAIAAHEAIAPFDPAGFDAERRLEKWEPGREVRFSKPTGWAAFGCAPGLLFFLTAPVVFIVAQVSSPGDSPAELGGRLLGALAFGLFGLVPAGLALLVVWSSAGTTVTLDWQERRLLWRRPFSRKNYAFSEFQAIELSCVRSTLRNGSGSSTHYSCRVTAQLANEGRNGKARDSVVIVSTRSHPDPDTPYRTALPLATELAQALGLPRVVTEQSI